MASLGTLLVFVAAVIMERIVSMITHRHLQVRQWNLALEPCGRWDANVVEFHCAPSRPLWNASVGILVNVSS
jgi:hypothetical protein